MPQLTPEQLAERFPQLTPGQIAQISTSPAFAQVAATGLLTAQAAGVEPDVAAITAEAQAAARAASSRFRRRLLGGVALVGGVVAIGAGLAARRRAQQAASAAALAPTPAWPGAAAFVGAPVTAAAPSVFQPAALAAPSGGFFPSLVSQFTGLLPTGLRLPTVPSTVAMAAAAPAQPPSLWSRFWTFAGQAAPTVIQALGIGGGAALAGAGVGVGAAAAGVGVGGAALRLAAPSAAALPAPAAQAALPAPAVGAPSPGIDWDMIYLMR